MMCSSYMSSSAAVFDTCAATWLPQSNERAVRHSRAGRQSGKAALALENARKRRRGRRSSANPFIDAVMLEDLAHGGTHDEDDCGSDDYSDLEDFIVCKPGRRTCDYVALIDEHFRYSADEYGASQRMKRSAESKSSALTFSCT